MKKVLEAELLSIAHRILQMKNKDDVQNLYQESKELYEKLLILKFHEDNFNLIQPNISAGEIENKLEKAYQVEATIRSQMPMDLMDEEYPLVIETEVETHKIQVEEEIAIQAEATKMELEVEEPIEEPIAVNYTDAVVTAPYLEEVENSELVHFLESEDWTKEDLEEEKALRDSEELVDSQLETEDSKELEEVLNLHLINKDGIPNEEQQELVVEKTLEDSFFGVDYQDVDFIRVEEIDREHELMNELVFEPVFNRSNIEREIPVSETDLSQMIAEDKTERLKTLNEAFSQNISVSLNDRIAFEKHLFGGSSEDFNRVLSQINTFNSLDQALAFIDDLVKPDYNYWTGKEEYVSRLMELIEKRFA